MKQLSALLLVASITMPSFAITVYEFDNPAQEARYQALIEDFRCPTCQNQNLAGSDAPIAQDLKQKTYEMIKDGRSDGEIRDFMFNRYGDFISYKPPVRPSTWILWFFPPILLVVLLLWWIIKNRKNNKHKEQQFKANQPLSKQEEQALNALLKLHKPTQNQPSQEQQ